MLSFDLVSLKLSDLDRLPMAIHPEANSGFFCEMLQFGRQLFPETLALASLYFKSFFVSFLASLGSFLGWMTACLESKSEFFDESGQIQHQ